LTDHQCKLVCLLMVTWAQFPRGQADCGRRRLPQCPLLVGTENELGQLLAACIREYRN
jgi:hypothetical protein